MAKMERYRVRKSTKWSSINLTAIEDPDLSPKAKFIHTYLMTRPPNWEIRTKDIIKRSTAGRDAIQAGLKELVDKRYIHRERIYKNGRISHWQYDVYEEPLSENLDPANPYQELPDLDPAFQDQENPVPYYIPSSSSKSGVSKETPWADPKVCPSEKTISVAIRKRKKPKTNNNGLLFDSNKKPNKRLDLTKWLDHHTINKYDDREKEIHRLQINLFAKRVQPAAMEVMEVLDYWNEIAFEMSTNGYKIPSHQLMDTKTMYMCQLIVTGILHTSMITVEDFKRAIDNYSWILENSPWYNKIYPFPKFFSNKRLFDDCINDNVRDNTRYVRKAKKKLDKEGLLEEVKRRYRRVRGREIPKESVDLYKWRIMEGDIKTVEDVEEWVN